MFRKLYPKARIYRKLNRTMFYWITEKKIIKGNKIDLPSGFNIIQLDTPNDLNKHEEWR